MIRLSCVLILALLVGCMNPTPVEPPVEPVPVATNYVKVTLTCGCTLRLRNNTDCCTKAYPALGKAMASVKQWALHYRDINEPVNDDAGRDVSGDYVTMPLKCGCPVVVYKPDSCPCFDREHYPELVAALDQVYILAKKYSRGK